MKPFRDLSGLVFGRLAVMRQHGRDKQKLRVWLCLCDCGNETIVRGSALVAGTTKSCGCLQADTVRITCTTHGLSGGRLKNGKNRVYRAWINMKSRCNNPNTPKFKNHGGKGISVCREWSNYANFHSWAVSNGYKDGLTLERKDNDKGYSPDNCMWATYKEQNINKNNNHMVTVDGVTMTISEWCAKLKIKTGAIYCRINRYGWNPEKAIKTPIRKREVRA